MKKFFPLAVVAAAVLLSAGCGGGREITVADILSRDGAFDGDITRDPGPPASFSVFLSSQPPHTLLAGTDPASPGVETRAFLSFSLASLPPSASIRRATVFLPILRVRLAAPPSVSLLVDMVSFPALDTLATEADIRAVFDASPILVGPSIAVFPGDAGTDKTFDATDAVVEARRRGLRDLQIRLIGSFGLVTIDDLDDPSAGAFAPLLRVEFS